MQRKTDKINHESIMKKFMAHKLPESKKYTPCDLRKDKNDKIKNFTTP